MSERDRLSAFRAGNALVAQIINGITSNIVELVEVITQKAGADLLKPLVSGLNSFYEFLKANRNAIADVFDRASQVILNIIPPLKSASDELMARFGDEFAAILQASIDLVINAFQGLSYAVAGLIYVFVEFDKAIPVVNPNKLGVCKDLNMVPHNVSAKNLYF